MVYGRLWLAILLGPPSKEEVQSKFRTRIHSSFSLSALTLQKEKSARMRNRTRMRKKEKHHFRDAFLFVWSRWDCRSQVNDVQWMKAFSRFASAAFFISAYLASKLSDLQKRKKHLLLIAKDAFIRVIPLGFEPRTHTLKVYCSTSWATESSCILICMKDVPYFLFATLIRDCGCKDRYLLCLCKRFG